MKFLHDIFTEDKKDDKYSSKKTMGIISGVKDVREIEVINLEEVSDKFEVEDVYGNVTIHEHKTK